MRDVMMAVGLLLASAALPMAATAQTAEATPDAQLRQAETQGQAVFRHQRAMTVAAAALQDIRAFRRDRRVQGAFSQERNNRIEVTAYGAEENGPVAALYRVSVTLEGQLAGAPVVLPGPSALSAAESATVRAREIAAQQSFEPCERRYDTLVLPDPTDSDRWAAYLLPTGNKDEVVPIGGSYRIDIDVPRARAALRPLSSTCETLKNDENVFGLLATYPFGEIPSELHVYWALRAGKPFYVTTSAGKQLWLVEGASINRVERGS